MNSIYPESERFLLESINLLMDDWEKIASTAITSDGFYPYYSSQNIKILYIARESLDLAGCDYIECLYEAYKNKKVGDRHINQHFFHRRLIYLTYGLNNGMPKFNTIPYASDICDTFGTSHGISFAFMNISKTSNETKYWQTQWDALDKSVNESVELIKREVELLSPDLIITGNLGVNLINKTLCVAETLRESDLLNAHIVKICGKDTLLLDVYHFSATKCASGGLTDLEGFYEPVCQAVSDFSNYL